MDGLLNGKPLPGIKLDDLGGTPTIFGNIHILTAIIQQLGLASYFWKFRLLKRPVPSSSIQFHQALINVAAKAKDLGLPAGRFPSLGLGWLNRRNWETYPSRGTNISHFNHFKKALLSPRFFFFFPKVGYVSLLTSLEGMLSFWVISHVFVYFHHLNLRLKPLRFDPAMLLFDLCEKLNST